MALLTVAAVVREAGRLFETAVPPSYKSTYEANRLIALSYTDVLLSVTDKQEKT
jgi:hypothetical protein